jgi:hypothetical protein
MKDLPKIFILSGLVIILALLFFYFYFFRIDLYRIKQRLKKEIKRGDIVLFLPDWEKNDILALDGLPLFTSSAREYVNLYGFTRLFIIQNRRHYKPTSTPLLNELFLNKRLDFGHYQLEEFRLPDFNLSSYVDSLKVSIEDEKGRRVCPREKDKYKCGDMGWQYVGLATVDVNGQMAECIWAHPIANKRIIIEADLPSGLAGNFVFYRALSSTSGFDPIKPEVQTAIFINDRHQFSSVLIRQREWVKDRFKFGDGSPQSLRIEVTTPQEYKNHFCFNLEAF